MTGEVKFTTGKQAVRLVAAFRLDTDRLRPSGLKEYPRNS